MNVFKRLKNIWELGGAIKNSEKPTHILHNLNGITETSEVNKMAQIIKLKPKDEVEESLEQVNPENHA